MVVSSFLILRKISGVGELPYKIDGHAPRLAQGRKFLMLVSHLGCSRRNSKIFIHQGLVYGFSGFGILLGLHKVLAMPTGEWSPLVL